MDEDDDFGDFGGFEAADPNENPPEGNVEAGASPWAVFPPVVAQSQPDLLCAQNTFPTYLDPSGINGGPGNNNNNNHQRLDITASATDRQDSPRHHNDTDPARLAENILDGTIRAGVPGLDLTPGQPPSRADNPADIFLNTDQARDNTRVLPDLGVGEGATLPDLGVGEGPSLLPRGVNQIERDLELAATVNSVIQPVLNESASIPGSNGHIAPSASDNISVVSEDGSREMESAANEEIQSLRALNSKLEEDLNRTRNELQQQQKKLAEIEGGHSEEMKSLRQAGHDTLAVVVEQYKESNKVAKLEHQEISTQYIQQKIRELTESFEKSFDQLQAEFKERLDSEEEAHIQRIKEAVEQSRQEQQEKFDKFLEEEREKQKEEIQKALEAERESSQAKLAEAIKASQDASESKMAEAEEKMRKRLQDSEKESRVNVQAALKFEQTKMEENLREVLKEERERNRVAMETVSQQAREDSQQYINQQRQIDSRVRRRHLASLDLFLESARQQIQLLHESEDPHSNQSEPSKSADKDSDADSNS
ncbi:hypothetical protein LOTGIDRAFT_237245 [Lottia gigantea]|uniref:Uncharacterized protein n=1 Tax=Lottia gigantea TaxID=225164 RepID=V4BAW7_LOTGI|nr:hypothetical protein LOTGIDRAFT_237245 [Lottia gigantea]ESP04681.1 hypothetical protein LOTGIDRAFT_237245 [Lottia gigantea]